MRSSSSSAAGGDGQPRAHSSVVWPHADDVLRMRTVEVRPGRFSYMSAHNFRTGTGSVSASACASASASWGRVQSVSRLHGPSRSIYGATRGIAVRCGASRRLRCAGDYGSARRESTTRRARWWWWWWSGSSASEQPTGPTEPTEPAAPSAPSDADPRITR
jgi:hypothetical protein